MGFLAQLSDLWLTIIGLTIYMGFAFGLAFLLNWHWNKYRDGKGGN